METMRPDCDILSHQFCGQQGGGTSTHVAPWCERNLVFVKIKNIKQGWERKSDRDRDVDAIPCGRNLAWSQSRVGAIPRGCNPVLTP